LHALLCSLLDAENRLSASPSGAVPPHPLEFRASNNAASAGAVDPQQVIHVAGCGCSAITVELPEAVKLADPCDQPAANRRSRKLVVHQAALPALPLGLCRRSGGSRPLQDGPPHPPCSSSALLRAPCDRRIGQGPSARNGASADGAQIVEVLMAPKGTLLGVFKHDLHASRPDVWRREPRAPGGKARS